MQNLTKEKVCSDLWLQKIRYERQIESVKQIDREITNLIKTNSNEKTAIILQEQFTKQCQTGGFKSTRVFKEKTGLKKTGCQ